MNFCSKITVTASIALICAIPVIAQPASAASFKDKPVHCYFFQGEKLAIDNTCKSSGGSWAGGGGHSLKWNDGVTTQITFGLQGRGTPACPNSNQMAVDNVCGKTYYRIGKNTQANGCQ
jgi:hypothetical protein